MSTNNYNIFRTNSCEGRGRIVSLSYRRCKLKPHLSGLLAQMKSFLANYSSTTWSENDPTTSRCAIDRNNKIAESLSLVLDNTG
jgi:hypothetical protein